MIPTQGEFSGGKFHKNHANHCRIFIYVFIPDTNCMKVVFLIAAMNDTVLWSSYFVFHSTNEIVTIRGSSLSYIPNRPLRYLRVNFY